VVAGGVVAGVVDEQAEHKLIKNMQIKIDDD